MHRLLKFLLILLLLLVAAEIVVRLIPNTGEPRRINFGYPEGLWSTDDTLGHVLKHGYHGTFTRHERYAIDIDHLGSRTPPGGKDPGPGRRLVVIGDGIAFGKYVKAEESFPALLQNELPGLTVDSRAVPFYSLPHYELLVEQLIQEQIAGVVLLVLNPNDLEPLYTHPEVCRALGIEPSEDFTLPAGDPQLDLEEVSPLPAPLCYSALCSELRKLWWRMQASSDPDRHDPHRGYVRVQLQRCEREEGRDIAAGIDHIARMLRVQGLKLAAITLPDEFQLSGEDPRSESGLTPADLFAEATERAGVPFLDLREPFLGEKDPRGLILPNDLVHLSPRGHGLVARLVAEWLRAEGLI